ncbi:hypothetical protein D3C75_1200570 [compost metagenome]
MLLLQIAARFFVTAQAVQALIAFGKGNLRAGQGMHGGFVRAVLLHNVHIRYNVHRRFPVIQGTRGTGV